MGPQPAPALDEAGYTWDDFVALDEDDLRELDDGRLVEIEVPTLMHEWIVTQLVTLLNNWARQRKAGIVLASGYKVRIRKNRGFMPDVQFTRAARMTLLDEQGLTRGAPDLVVEVVSPSSRRYDRIKKLASYAEIGTAEYWIVDGEAQTLERLVLRDRRYEVRDAHDGDEVFRPEGWDGLEIPLAGLWTLPEAAPAGD